MQVAVEPGAMSPPTLNAVILAAGEGKRLGGSRPKVLTPLWGLPALAYPVAAALGVEPGRVLVVVGRHREAIATALSATLAADAGGGSGPGRLPAGACLDTAADLVTQDPPLGTGHAVLCAREALAGVSGTLLVINGDTPLVPSELLADLVAEHERKGAVVSVVSMHLEDPAGYGRMLRDAQGELQAITEAADASPEVLEITEVNAGVWALSLPEAWDLLTGLGRDNSQGEVYLTDLVAAARAADRPVGSLVWGDPEDLLGFNDHLDLALARAVLRERILAGHLARGVELVDPETTYIDATVDIAPGARVLPCTMIEGRSRIGAGCEAGPFAHLRDGTVLEPGAEIGNFTETKQTTVGAGSKAKHLTYLGDTVIGAGTNIGAGTITANYDGKHKHRTTIGDGAFIGSGTVIVAPAEVADGGVTGAGAVVRRHSRVGSHETWVGVPARRLRKAGDRDPQARDGGDGDA